MVKLNSFSTMPYLKLITWEMGKKINLTSFAFCWPHLSWAYFTLGPLQAFSGMLHDIVHGMAHDNKASHYTTLQVNERCQLQSSTWWVCVPLKVLVQDFKCLWSERRSPFPLLWGFTANEVGEILYSILVALLCLTHPPLQHWLDLLCTLGCNVQLFKPTKKKAVLNPMYLRAFR